MEDISYVEDVVISMIKYTGRGRMSKEEDIACIDAFLQLEN